jgi:FkbM family methyltransferase
MSPRLKIVATFLGMNTTPFVIQLRNGLQFHVRTAMDIWVIKETCLDRDYEHYGTPLQSGWHIVDIGGGLGDFTLYAAGVKASIVHAYEPFPESRDLLHQNLKLNQIADVMVYSDAVSSQHGELHLTTATGVAVRHSITADANTADLTVSAIPLATVLDRMENGTIDFLKMDCEGAEYDILLNASDTTLEAISHICMEYHDDLTPHTHHELVAFLSNRGYDVMTYRNPAHQEIGFLYARNIRNMA